MRSSLPSVSPSPQRGEGKREGEQGKGGIARIPAKAEIQFRSTGFRVKPGMTNKVKGYLRNTLGVYHLSQEGLLLIFINRIRQRMGSFFFPSPPWSLVHGPDRERHHHPEERSSPVHYVKGPHDRLRGSRSGQ